MSSHVIVDAVFLLFVAASLYTAINMLSWVWTVVEGLQHVLVHHHMQDSCCMCASDTRTHGSTSGTAGDQAATNKPAQQVRQVVTRNMQEMSHQPLCAMMQSNATLYPVAGSV